MHEIRSGRFTKRDGRLYESAPNEPHEWTGFSIFIPAGDPEEMKNDLNKRGFRYVEVYAAQEPPGVWLIGGHHWLEKAAGQLTIGETQ
jgi:hypothetical protein